MPYPDIKTRDAPQFISAKYVSVVGLLAEVARRAEPYHLPPFDADAFANAFPAIQDAFAASAEQLEQVFAGEREHAQQYRKIIQRLMLWEDFDGVLSILRSHFDSVIANLPRRLDDIEDGGRDLLDPFIVAFASRLLHAGSVSAVLGTLSAHKCLMKLEDMIGHIHQGVLGRAAGGQYVPEPQGVADASGKKNKEDWHQTLNPYPGADARRGNEEFYQIKNKTGSAKGSDGEKLGRQFLVLKAKYQGCERFYVSMIGRTLSGHRSMGGFLRKDPDAEVLVGLAAFQQLGRHRDTATIVMELYTEEFDEGLRRNVYRFEAIVQQLTAEWIEKHGDGDPGLRLLADSITPTDPKQQSSKTYKGRGDREGA